MKKLIILVIGLVLVLVPSSSFSQDDRKPDISRWECGCRYPIRCTAGKRTLLTKEFIVIFHIKKGNENEAVVRTVFETTEDASVLFNYNGGITLIQLMGDGNVATTTIDLNGHSVHSRNMIFGEGELYPSQYYGICKCIDR